MEFSHFIIYIHLCFSYTTFHPWEKGTCPHTRLVEQVAVWWLGLIWLRAAQSSFDSSGFILWVRARWKSPKLLHSAKQQIVQFSPAGSSQHGATPDVPLVSLVSGVLHQSLITSQTPPPPMCDISADSRNFSSACPNCHLLLLQGNKKGKDCSFSYTVR